VTTQVRNIPAQGKGVFFASGRRALPGSGCARIKAHRLSIEALDEHKCNGIFSMANRAT
jgi:hypothetical protein